ncbi:MAG: isoaspartyl peptidase/L-asparaginase [Bacteroidetes bacterium]|nr:isoaspartyl peptidase/L-asparaginase [Bacteroidota bacterium]
MAKYTIAIHGGAGTIRKEEMTAEKESAYKNGLNEALNAGFHVLKNGGTAVDAVRAAVVSLEDNILFNAGKGSVFGNDKSQEMDAAIMDGRTRNAGSVSAVRNIRNPIELAYKVMTESEHVMLSGRGAEEFAKLHHIRTEPDEYFFSAFRFEQWKLAQQTDKVILDHTSMEKKFGTVGAVACDEFGNIAAATSTGGMTNKQWGRIGDSPIIGAGTYANSKTCAISCTGHGEPFIRAVTAYDVSCLMEYKGLTLYEAMHLVVHDKLLQLDGEGGMIGVDAQGNAAMLFNSEGMYRGKMNSEGEKEVLIYKN